MHMTRVFVTEESHLAKKGKDSFCVSKHQSAGFVHVVFETNRNMAATGEEVRAEEVPSTEEEELVVVESVVYEEDVEEVDEDGDDEGEEDDDDEEEEEDEEDPVDPLDTLKEKCAASGASARMKARYDDCVDRVTSKTSTTESCKEEFLDFIESVDHCAGVYILDQLK